MSRVLKQLIIGGVYVVIVGVMVFWSYNSSYGPTCQDGIQNGREEGIDCGTIACGMACASPVQAIQVQSVQLVSTPAGDHDLAMQFYNPNTNYGVALGTYQLTLGSQISSHDFYMLPGQTKDLVLTSLKGVVDGVSANVVIKDIQWEKVVGDASVSLTSSNERYLVLGNQTTFEGTILNNSDFDFDSVDISIIVSDSSGKILATNTTSIQTILSRSSRYVKVSWPFALPADARVSVEVSTNVFDNTNYIKTHGTQEKFQQLF
ncbi:MAG: hypothetical protein A3I39_01225 [Candidatus Yanofskybacteria bacterium RIFCSPLOWO2_02_FULL_47_9b]|uniref:Uncharacterized protein n=1 Tax=Candidatus Yanofskybacteria bacterium RIFCSPLOWO2_02_FULL_47_9b TaxID=1802708 RepID=A0A1F8H9G4_9BACT|nr:MAG: hypothetical protein A3I39_01225 [Candidatus Yanofskybacteria bacterium RIFCSPLOWO2_02_FULL_47_9b]